MRLEDILQSLEKSAGFPEDLKKENDKEESSDGEAEGEKKDKKESGKEEAKDKKDEKGDQEKSAAFKSGEQLAREIMEKVASQKIEQSKGEEMNKQASDAGKALAQALLTKLAGVGDENTENGIAPGAVPNKTQVDLAQQVAEHDNSFQATPGTDGAGEGGTINEIFDAIVADAQARTGAVVRNQSDSAPAEGAINAQAPAQVQVDESVEKMAAAIALVNSGIDFDDAVDLVKAAAEELEYEEEEQIKQAAFDELVEAGVDFELAAAMIKEAGRLDAAKAAIGSAYGAAKGYGAAGYAATKGYASRGYGAAKGYATRGYDSAKGYATGAYNKAAPAVAAYGRNVKTDAGRVPGQLKMLATGTVGNGNKVSRLGIAKDLAQNRAVQLGAGGAALAGAGAYAMTREKKAAFDMLVEQGVDFDTAVNLVNDKAAELYGE